MAKKKRGGGSSNTKPPERRRSTAREYTEAILIAFLFLRFANTFVLQTFYIPSESMETTLLVGDHLFVNRFIYGTATSEPESTLLPRRPVQRGDVVVFRSKEDPAVDVVKRCVAVPGDVVEIREKDFYLNGELVEDDAYTRHADPLTFQDVPAYSPRLRQRDNYGPETVPEDHYFCLGDNRDNSHDSRFWGFLPARLVKGRASIIYWSYGGEMSPEQAGAGQRLRHLGRVVLGFVTKTRWERTFRLVR